MQSAQTVLAVDGGGSGFRKALVCGSKITNLQEVVGIKTTDALVDFVNSDISADVAGIVYAVAGIIPDHDKIEISPNIPFLNGVALGTLTRLATGKPSVVCNDVEGGAVGGGILFPFLRDYRFMTVSSGIGGRLVCKGKLLGLSEEIGHIQLDSSPFAPLCGCGKRGCAELLTGERLQWRVRQEAAICGIEIPAGYKYPSMFLHEEYDKGAEWAMGIYKMLIWGMARFFANLQNSLCVPAFVLKGGLAKQLFTRVEQQIRAQMREMLIIPKWEENLQIHYCWGVEPCKDADALLGGAKIWQDIQGQS